MLSAALAVALAIHSSPVSEWEHGMKTQNIVATRYKSDMGYMVGFRYLSPRYDNNADRTDVSDFFDKHGCHIGIGGGEPFSEYIASCDGVTDSQTANTKLRVFLPALDKFMGGLRP